MSESRIRLISKAPFPLPIRTGVVETLRRNRIQRNRDGTSGVKAEQFRSETTVTINQGRANAIECGAEWLALPDVKQYRKRNWLHVEEIPGPDAGAIASTAPKEPRSDRSDRAPKKRS